MYGLGTKLVNSLRASERAADAVEKTTSVDFCESLVPLDEACFRTGHAFGNGRTGAVDEVGQVGTSAAMASTDRGWRMCACKRSIPEHGEQKDPAGGPGCGMQYRKCARCGQVDERHVTDADGRTDADDLEAQPGGHLRQDVPAGLALPTHHDTADQHAHDGEEMPMVEPARSGAAAPRPRPEIVTVCGSMRFFEQMLEFAAAETAGGAIVLAPFVVVPPAAQGGDNAELKARLDDLHRHKIAMADRVVVITDEARYIGSSTRAEIGYARRCGLPITVVAGRTTGDAQAQGGTA